MWPSPEVRQLCQPSDRLCLELMPNPRPWCLEKALVSLCSLNGVLYLLASTERVLGLLVWINAGGSHMSSEVALQCTQPPWGLSLSGIYCLILLVSRSNQCKYADVLSCARLLEMGQWCWWTLILRQNTLANRPSESCRFETHCYPDSRVQPQIGPHRHWCHTEFTTSLWHRNLDSKPPHPGPSSTNSGFLTDPAAPCQDPGWGFGGLRFMTLEFTKISLHTFPRPSFEP